MLLSYLPLASSDRKLELFKLKGKGRQPIGNAVYAAVIGRQPTEV